MKFFIILSLVTIFCLIQLCFCDDPYGYGALAEGGGGGLLKGGSGGYGNIISLDRVVKRKPVGYLGRGYGRSSKLARSKLRRKNILRPLNLDTYSSPLPSPAVIFGKGYGSGKAGNGLGRVRYGYGKTRYGSGRPGYGYGKARYGAGRTGNGYGKAVYGAGIAGYGIGGPGYGSAGKLKLQPIVRLIDGFDRHSLPIQSPEQYDSDLYSGLNLDSYSVSNLDLYSDTKLDSYSNTYSDTYSDSNSNVDSDSDSYAEPYTGLYSYSSSMPLAAEKDLQDVKDGEVIGYEEYDGGFEIVRKSVY